MPDEGSSIMPCRRCDPKTVLRIPEHEPGYPGLTEHLWADTSYVHIAFQSGPLEILPPPLLRDCLHLTTKDSCHQIPNLTRADEGEKNQPLFLFRLHLQDRSRGKLDILAVRMEPLGVFNEPPKLLYPHSGKELPIKDELVPLVEVGADLFILLGREDLCSLLDDLGQ